MGPVRHRGRADGPDRIRRETMKEELRRARQLSIGVFDDSFDAGWALFCEEPSDGLS